MSKVIEGIKYADSHEWVKVEGNIGIIGILVYVAVPRQFGVRKLPGICSVGMNDTDAAISFA